MASLACLVMLAFSGKALRFDTDEDSGIDATKQHTAALPVCTTKTPWSEDVQKASLWDHWARDFGAAANIVRTLREKPEYANKKLLFVGQSPAYIYSVLNELNATGDSFLLPYSGGRQCWELMHKWNGPTDLFKSYFDIHKTDPSFLRYVGGYMEICEDDLDEVDEYYERACPWWQGVINGTKKVPTNETDCEFDENEFCFIYLGHPANSNSGLHAKHAYCTKLAGWLGSDMTMANFNELIVVDYSNSGSIDAFAALVASCGDGLELDSTLEGGAPAAFAKGNLDGLKLKDGWNPIPFWNIRQMAKLYLKTGGSFAKFMQHTETVMCSSAEEFVLDDWFDVPRLVPSFSMSEWDQPYDPSPHWGNGRDDTYAPAIAECLTKAGVHYAQSPPESGPTCQVA